MTAILLLENLVCTRYFGIGTNFSCVHDSAMSMNERIKRRRTELDMSMHALAEKCGYKSWQTVQQWEREVNPTSPKRKQIPAVAAALGVSEEWLLLGDGHGVESVEGAMPVSGTSRRKISVFGRAMGGFPERIVDDDGGWPPGFSDEYADVSSSDPNGFLVPVEGESMVPRFNPGEYALIEPNTEPEIEDDVLVRMGDGRTMLKRLLSRRGVIRLGSYNSQEVISAPPETIVWMYYAAHPVPARKIKIRF